MPSKGKGKNPVIYTINILSNNKLIALNSASPMLRASIPFKKAQYIKSYETPSVFLDDRIYEYLTIDQILTKLFLPKNHFAPKSPKNIMKPFWINPKVQSSLIKIEIVNMPFQK